MRLVSSFISSIQLLQHFTRLFVKMQISSRLITSEETKQSLGKSLWKCRTYYTHKSWTPWISPFQLLLVSSHSDKEWSFCRAVNPSTERNMAKFYTSTCSFKALVYICRCNKSCSDVDKNHVVGPQRRSLKTWVEKSQCCSQKELAKWFKGCVHLISAKALTEFPLCVLISHLCEGDSYLKCLYVLCSEVDTAEW